jgi:hypothetical protein
LGGPGGGAIPVLLGDWDAADSLMMLACVASMDHKQRQPAAGSV